MNKHSFSYVILLIVFIFSCSKVDNKIQGTIDTLDYGIKKEWSLGDSLIDFGERKDTKLSMVFGRINSIAVSDKKKIYLLDSDTKKISVFDSLGKFEGEILGGYGRGPGEFELPISIDVGDDGLIAVYDYNSSRVSFFSEESGEFIESMNITVPSKYIIYSDGKVYASIFGGRRYALTRNLKSNEEFEYKFELSERDLEFAGDAALFALGKNTNNELLVASQTPGIWHLVNGTGVQKFGKELLPNRKAEYLNELGMYATPAYTIGIGELSDGNVAIVWYEMVIFEEKNPEISAYYLDIFSPEGKHLDRIGLPFKWIQSMSFDNDSGVYFAVNEPYTRVLKYNIQKKK